MLHSQSKPERAEGANPMVWISSLIDYIFYFSYRAISPRFSPEESLTFAKQTVSWFAMHYGLALWLFVLRHTDINIFWIPSLIPEFTAGFKYTLAAIVPVSLFAILLLKWIKHRFSPARIAQIIERFTSTTQAQFDTSRWKWFFLINSGFVSAMLIALQWTAIHLLLFVWILLLGRRIQIYKHW
jgi:hypothetical protein